MILVFFITNFKGISLLMLFEPFIMLSVKFVHMNFNSQVFDTFSQQDIVFNINHFLKPPLNLFCLDLKITIFVFNMSETLFTSASSVV